jgi:predicted dehydrogenase
MTIRWGILGCGDVVRKRVAGAIAGEPRSRLVAACRRDAGRIELFCRENAIERPYTRDAELLADRQIDAVYIATPVDCHLPQTLAAAAAGKQVLVEKPMALSPAACDEMIAACRAAGVKLGVAYYRRFYPVVERMSQIIAGGEIGRPLSVAALCSTPLGMRPGEEGYWRVDPASGGGGSLMDIGSHRLNLFLHLFGPIEVVKALCGTQAATYAAEDSATLALRFASGMHGSLRCFFGMSIDPDEFAVEGTRGRLFASPLNGGRLVVDVGSSRRVEDHPPAGNFNAPLVADFVDAILDNRAPRVTGEEGRAVNEVMQRAYRNAHSPGE